MSANHGGLLNTAGGEGANKKQVGAGGQNGYGGGGGGGGWVGGWWQSSLPINDDPLWLTKFEYDKIQSLKCEVNITETNWTNYSKSQ